MHECKIMPKTASQALQSDGLHPFWSCLWHLEFAKSVGKMCISSLWALFGGFVCPYVFYRIHFAWNLYTFGMLSSWFCFKIDPALGSYQCLQGMSYTCRYDALILDPFNTLNPSNPCPLAGIADCELHALFRRPEIAVAISPPLYRDRCSPRFRT